jgi:dihydrofolate synthase/folylpolyglutamate synthase
MKFKSQQDVIAWIQSFQRFGIKPGLERVKWMLTELGNPEENLQIIHVAGTNGKGSTCKMIASVLEANGYKIGLFTSPYLDAFNNRIAINDRDIDSMQLCEVATAVQAIITDMPVGELGAVTEFEIITVLGLLYFYKQRVDFVVLEVGLGGRLDATNVISPIITVITNIGLDHINILGSSLAEIASEKAGIIKAGIPVISGVKQPESIQVIRQKSLEKNSKLYELGTDFHNKIDSISLDELHVQVLFEGKHILNNPSWVTRLVATYQSDNLSLALATLQVLYQQQIIDISLPQTKQGLFDAVWEGRFEVIQRQPIVIVDGAHNPEGMAALIDSLNRHFGNNKKYLWCVGFLQDKEIAEMLQMIINKANKIVVTKPNSDRSADPYLVQEQIIQQAPIEVYVNSDILEAVKTALIQADKDDIICIAGSLYMVSEARKWWAN